MQHHHGCDRKSTEQWSTYQRNIEHNYQNGDHRANYKITFRDEQGEKVGLWSCKIGSRRNAFSNTHEYWILRAAIHRFKSIHSPQTNARASMHASNEYHPPPHHPTFSPPSHLRHASRDSESCSASTLIQLGRQLLKTNVAEKEDMARSSRTSS